MKILILFIFLSSNTFGPSFEGKITYYNTYKSKSLKVTDTQLEQQFGSNQEYYIKNGNYKSVFSGFFLKMQLYQVDKNMSYMLTAKSDSLYAEDYSVNENPVIKFELTKNVDTVMGIKCDKIVIWTARSKSSYLFNTSYEINPNLFLRHKYGNWYFYLTQAPAIPLKIIYEEDGFSLISTAIKITRMPLNDDIFALPPNAKISITN